MSVSNVLQFVVFSNKYYIYFFLKKTKPNFRSKNLWEEVCPYQQVHPHQQAMDADNTHAGLRRPDDIPGQDRRRHPHVAAIQAEGQNAGTWGSCASPWKHRGLRVLHDSKIFQVCDTEQLKDLRDSRLYENVVY